MQADGTADLRFADPHGRIDCPTWCPDGGWVSFERAALKEGELRLREAAR